MAKIDELLRRMKDKDASDLYLCVGSPPKFRVYGEIELITEHPVLTNESCAEYLFEIISDEQREQFLERHDLDFAYGIEGFARFRCNYFFQYRGLGGVFRLIPTEIMSLDDLGAPPVTISFAHIRGGLVVVTGPTGSGKSTTLASLIDYMNNNFDRHILTIEDPIEFVHENKKCLITQREVGSDTDSFASALRSATRADPDVILVGELRDLETISLALTAAETGILVFGTLHTNSAAKTIDRVIDIFPASQQAQVRTQLAQSLRGIVAQQLLRTADGKGRIAAFEILVGSPALSSIIREGNVAKIVSLIESGKNEGMQSMDSAIAELLEQGKIEGREAYLKASDKKLFEEYFE